MQARRLHPECEQGDDDLLDRPGRPRPGEPHAPAVITDRHVPVLLPDDVWRWHGDGRLDADIGESVVQEAHVIEHVLARGTAEYVRPQPCGSGGHLF